MKKVLFKNSVKQIMKTHKRFISILLMAFLGVGFFAGVRATSPDMKKTVDSYFDSTNMYDISIVSTLGLTDEDINAVSKVEGVDKAYGLYSEDVFVSLNGEESIVKLYAYDENINKLEIIDGKLPENVDECVIEVSMKDSESISIGDYIDIRENLGEDEDTSFKNTKLKVVGIVRSPLYISRDRGTTTLGSGKINYYMFVNKENIISDVYTEIDVLVNDAKNLDAIIMVDSNLQQRQKILFSERAFAYKIRMEAEKHQGKRTDLTSCQVGTKLRTDLKLAEKSDDSARQIQRYIRLTELIKPLLVMVDSEEIAFSPAVELSFLTKQEQKWLMNSIECNVATPSLSQAQEMKRLSQSGKLSEDKIEELLSQQKPNQVEKLKLDFKNLTPKMPRGMPKEKYADHIYKALDFYNRYLEKKRSMEAR